MEILQRDDGKAGSFFVEENGKTVGEIFYTHSAVDRIIVTHTEVDSSQGGKGIGHKLVMAVVDYARANHLKIKPLCPFTKKVLTRSPEYADILV